jgi:hypothetical protein
MASRIALNLGADPARQEGFIAQTEGMRGFHPDLEFILFKTRDDEMMLLLPDGTKPGARFDTGPMVARSLLLPNGGHMSCDDEMLEVLAQPADAKGGA